MSAGKITPSIQCDCGWLAEATEIENHVQERPANLLRPSAYDLAGRRHFELTGCFTITYTCAHCSKMHFVDGSHGSDSAIVPLTPRPGVATV